MPRYSKRSNQYKPLNCKSFVKARVRNFACLRGVFKLLIFYKAATDQETNPPYHRFESSSKKDALLMSHITDESMNSKFDPKRRGFMSAAIYALATLMTGAFSASVSTYLFGKPETEDYGWADAGDVSNLQPGSPQQISFSRSREDGWKLRNEKSAAWVIIDERKHVTAFPPICTHLGCAYHWQMDRKAFACPCHGRRLARTAM